MAITIVSTDYDQLIYRKEDYTLHQMCKLEKGNEHYTVELHQNKQGQYKVISDRIAPKKFKSYNGAMAFYHRCVGAFIVGGCTLVSVETYQDIIIGANNV